MREKWNPVLSLDRKQGPDSTLETQWLVPPPTCTLAARLWVQPRLGQWNAPAQSRGSTPRLQEQFTYGNVLVITRCISRLQMENEEPWFLQLKIVFCYLFTGLKNIQIEWEELSSGHGVPWISWCWDRISVCLSWGVALTICCWLPCPAVDEFLSRVSLVTLWFCELFQTTAVAETPVPFHRAAWRWAFGYSSYMKELTGTVLIHSLHLNEMTEIMSL